MTKTRLEAFSDAVIAIVITLMALELRVPDGVTWEALRPVLPVFLAYVLSFTYLAIYWNNHHHMLHAADHVDGRILWANMHLLFWLSLTPFATGWLTEHGVASVPTAIYGVILFMAAISYTVLQSTIIAHGGVNAQLKEAVGRDWKGKSSILAYAAAIALAFADPRASIVLYVVVALMWFVPDPRIERTLNHSH